MGRSDQLPLAGLRVLVTRPLEQAGGLLQRLRDLGAEPVPCPAIRIAAPDNCEPLDRAARDAAEYDWIVFTSVNGVRSFWERFTALGGDGRQLAGVRLAAIGPATAQALAGLGLEVALVPQRYVAEAILDEIGDVAGQRILLPRADIARKALADGLRARGANVDEVVAYRTLAGSGELPHEPVDIVTFTSPSTVRSTLGMLEAAGQVPSAYLGPATVACIGPITAQAALAAGLRVDVVAEEHTAAGLLAAIVRHLQESEA